MTTETPTKTRKVVGIILSFDDGSAHVMEAAELDAFQKWMRDVDALLRYAAALVPIVPIDKGVQ